MYFYWLLLVFSTHIVSCFNFKVSLKKYNRKVDYGSTLTVTPSSNDDIKNGSIKQTKRTYNNCNSTSIMAIWTGSSFLIGPAFTNYDGEYEMRFYENVTNALEMKTLNIYIRHPTPRVPSKTFIVDKGGTVNLICTYKANCVISNAKWIKDIDSFNSLLGKQETKKLGNNINSMTYRRTNAQTRFGYSPYYCYISQSRKVKVVLEVRDKKMLDVKFRKQTAQWFDENGDAKIEFTISGSPLPNMICSRAKPREEVISCSKSQMKRILYLAPSEACKSHDSRFVLRSLETQKERVELLIKNLALERDNGRLHCQLQNSRGQKDFDLDVNVKARPRVNLTREQNGTMLYCSVRSNPRETIHWLKCADTDEDSCKTMRTTSGENENTTEQSYVYHSRISIKNSDKGYYIRCEASNIFKYVFIENDTTQTNATITLAPKSDHNRSIIVGIAIGCSFLLILIIVFGLLLYVRERKMNKTYKKFFMANNHYTIDPLKSLNEQMHNLSYDEDWEFPFVCLEFHELIGSGAFGKVYKAKAHGIGLLNSRDKSVQAKKQRKELIKNRNRRYLSHCEENRSMTVAVKTTKDNPDVKDIRNLAGELKMIIHLGQHENIVNVLGACTKYPKLYMIIEYCPHGSLLEFLRKRMNLFQPTWSKECFSSKERLTIANLVSAATQVCNGMKFLTSKKCIHRDLAARNVLVAENYEMKVADFGMAREILDTDNYVSTAQGYFPVKWMALESILEKVFTEESDVWSFGILLWEMFTFGTSPYPAVPIENLLALLRSSERMERPACCPSSIYNLMLDCWDEDPKRRPSFQTLHVKLQSLLKENMNRDAEDEVDGNWNECFAMETTSSSENLTKNETAEQ